MTARGRRRAASLLACVATVVTVAFAAAQTAPRQPIVPGAGQDPAPNPDRAAAPPLVRFLYPEQITVAAGRPQQIELHFAVKEGMHIQSHTPRDPLLVPTRLIVPESPGLSVTAVVFPPGEDFAFAAAPADRLSVYSGEFVLRLELTARPGNHLFEAGLRYQACTNTQCLPPRTAPVAIDVQAR